MSNQHDHQNVKRRGSVGPIFQQRSGTNMMKLAGVPESCVLSGLTSDNLTTTLVSFPISWTNLGTVFQEVEHAKLASHIRKEVARKAVRLETDELG